MILALTCSNAVLAKEGQWLGIYTTDEILGECKILSHTTFHSRKGKNLNGENVPDFFDRQENALVAQAKSNGFNAIVGFQENFMSEGGSAYISYWGVAVKAVCK